MSKPAQKRKSVKPSMTRDNLSFTARVPRADGLDCPLLSNWSPVEVPYQEGQWSIGHALGAKMIDELACLADVDEQEAFDAIRFATIARTWRTGGHGVEMGFSDGISALAIIGLRYLSKGACPFDPEEEQKSRYWTGERLVEDAVVKYKKASGTLRVLYQGRAEGTISALFNVGLIDCGTYEKSFAEIKGVEQARAR